MQAERVEDKGRELPQGHHVEEDVQDPPVEKGGRDEGPPAAVGDGEGSGRAEEEEASVRRGEKRHGVGRKAERRRVEQDRKEVEGGIDGDDRHDRIEAAQGDHLANALFQRAPGRAIPQ